MAQYGPAFQTLEIFTGNVRTVQDLLQATLTGGASTSINYTANSAYPGNQLNLFGAEYWDNAPSAKVNGTLTQFPNGIPTKYRYVKYLSTDTTTIKAFPAPVFWTDAGMTTVSDLMSEGYTATQQSIAGWLMPNSADISGLTTALLNNNGNGSGVFIAVAGFVANAAAAAGNKGDWLIGGATGWLPVVVASGTATGYRQAAFLYANASAGAADIFVTVESL